MWSWYLFDMWSWYLFDMWSWYLFDMWSWYLFDKTKRGDKFAVAENQQCEKTYFIAVLRIHYILMRIRILNPHWKKMDPDPGHFLTDLLNFLTKNNFQILYLFFFAYFYPKAWWTIQKWGNFYNLSFSKVLWVLGIKKFFLQLLGDILPLDPDSWSQNLADPTDPDPKHCFIVS